MTTPEKEQKPRAVIRASEACPNATRWRRFIEKWAALSRLSNKRVGPSEPRF